MAHNSASIGIRSYVAVATLVPRPFSAGGISIGVAPRV